MPGVKPGLWRQTVIRQAIRQTERGLALDCYCSESGEKSGRINECEQT
jgi:hypothetical protein